jgi:ferredoxin
MTYVITQPCIDVKDKSRVDVCPVSCICLETDGLDRKLYIHPDECIDCGACEPECPVSAIFTQDAVPPEWAEFIDLDRKCCTGEDGAFLVPSDRHRTRPRYWELV